jgi:CRISPR-associated protein Cmr2
MDLRELILLKTAALFHDPPDKAWCLVRGEKHEKWAEELAHIALDGTPLSEAEEMLSDERVREADRLAASVDRVLLGELIGDKRGAFPEKSIKLKNPINPRIEHPIQVDLGKDKVEEVMRELNGVLKKTENVEEAYFALFGLYELIWIAKGLPSGPADTRIPTHTVFDHLYATATALNWTYEGGGLLLHIDIAGVQDFIAQSRRLRDLWASSYIISALLWSTVLNLIRYGPDVVLTPSCRFNPFFYCDLTNRVQAIGDYLKNIKIEGFEEILCERFSFPRFAVIPGSMTLVLPSFISDAEVLVEESFRRKWKEFCEGIMELDVPLSRDLEREVRYGFMEVPPFSMRISSVRVDTSKGGDNVYAKAFESLMNENRKKKLLKVNPACMLPLTEITREIFDGKGSLADSKRGFDYCTMCGKLPAIVRWDGRSSDEFLEEGERLCPYCLMKRIFSRRPGPVLRRILGYGRDLRISYPSLADIATFEFKDGFLRDLPSLDKLWKDEEIRELMGRVLESQYDERVLAWKYQLRKFEEIGESSIDPDLKRGLLGFLLAESEVAILGKEKRKLWSELRRYLEEKGIVIPPIGTYYALIRADGDDMGSILSGEIGVIGIDVKDYIVSSFEGKSREVVLRIMDSDYEKLKDIAKEENLNEENLRKTKEFLNEIISSRKIPVSLSYHVSISRALIISALRDIKQIEDNNGIVIYAGGDDLLSIAPVSSAIRIIDGSRRGYSGLDGSGRFHKLGNYLIPSMGDAGRSYSLYIAHYRYPLYAVVSDSSLKLEVAKGSVWVDGRERKKDSLIITYSARGSSESSILPLSLRDPGLSPVDLRFLDDLIGKIRSGDISVSLLYEASRGNFMETAERAWSMGKMEIFDKVIEYMIGRHIQRGEGREDILREIIEYIKRYEGVGRRDRDGEDPFFLNLFKSCRLLYSGLRGD